MSTPSSRCYYVVPTRSMMPSMKLSRNHEADVLMSRMARLLDPSMISSRQPEWRSGAASVKSCWIVSPGSPVYTFGARKVWPVFAPVMADLLRFLNSRLASGAVEAQNTTAEKEDANFAASVLVPLLNSGNGALCG